MSRVASVSLLQATLPQKSRTKNYKMFLPVVLISATFFVSASFGSEEVIPKPLLRYFEECQENEAQISELKTAYSHLQIKYSDLLESHSKVLLQLRDVIVNLEVEHLKALINQKNEEIELLKSQNSDLNKTIELGTLTNQFREKIEKIWRIESSEERGPQTEEIFESSPSYPSEVGYAQALVTIQIPGLGPVDVVMVWDGVNGDDWIKVYNNIDYDSIFNRTFEEYATGFGEVGVENEYFIGFDTWHLLTNGKPHEMRIWNHYVKCENFVIGNRSEGYMLKDLGGCTRDSQLSFSNGTKFSTYDRDEDGNPNHNWAKELGFGWWFDSTTTYNSIDPGTILIRRK